MLGFESLDTLQSIPYAVLNVEVCVGLDGNGRLASIDCDR